MKKIILLISLLVTLIVKGETPVYIHPETKIEVPQKLGPYQFLQGEFSANHEIGTILHFKSTTSKDSQLSIYVHKKEMNLNEQVLDAINAIKHHLKIGTYSKANIQDPTKIDDFSQSFTGYLENQDINDPSDVLKLNTYALLITLEDFTIKARLSSLSDFKEHKAHVKELEKALITLATKHRAKN